MQTGAVRAARETVTGTLQPAKFALPPSLRREPKHNFAGKPWRNFCFEEAECPQADSARSFSLQHYFFYVRPHWHFYQPSHTREWDSHIVRKQDKTTRERRTRSKKPPDPRNSETVQGKACSRIRRWKLHRKISARIRFRRRCIKKRCAIRARNTFCISWDSRGA